jgi:hypothetical protein
MMHGGNLKKFKPVQGLKFMSKTSHNFCNTQRQELSGYERTRFKITCTEVPISSP